MSEYITTTTENRITTLTITRPEKRNAITQAMYAAMADAVEQYGQDDEVRAFVFTGAEEYFTSGNDISDFAVAPQGDATPPVVRFLRAIVDCPKPLIAAVNGPAIGVGVTLLLHCDLVIASQNATFATPFVQLAVVPEAGSSILMPAALGMAVANDMLLAGRVLDASEALQFGLVSRVLAPDEFGGVVAQVAGQIAASAPTAMRLSKSLIRYDRKELLAHMDLEVQHFANQLKSAEFAEIVASKMQKRAPKF